MAFSILRNSSYLLLLAFLCIVTIDNVQHVQAKLTSDILRSPGVPLRPKLLQKVLRREKEERNLAKFTLATNASSVPAHNFSQLIDHFPTSQKYSPHPSSPNATFPQRFWVNTKYYKDGGPVIVIDAGETDGEGRVDFILTGVARKLAEATGGVAAVLEHRYYGESFPVSNLTTDELRFLDTAQSLADLDYFARTVTIPGLESKNLTAPGTPWIGYGGSYAGAKAAFLRTTYPETFWGTIASSGVVHAQWNYWQYNEAIRIFGEPNCIGLFVWHLDTLDRLLEKNQTSLIKEVKTISGLPNVTDVADYANAVGFSIGSWQSKNWDPALDSDGGLSDMCSTIVNASTSGLAPAGNATTELEKNLKKIISDPKGPVRQQNNLTDPTIDDKTVESTYNSFLVWLEWVKENIASEADGEDQDEVFGTADPSQYQNWTLANFDAVSWTYQFCTEYGFIQTGAPKDHPSLTTRYYDISYGTRPCRFTFPPGQYPNAAVPPKARTDVITKYGDFSIAYDRLAIVDGEQDPWRQACPHSFYAPHGGKREDTTTRPYKLIPGAVHHWDENGLENTDDEPAEIKKIHQEEIEFVKAWLKDFPGKA